ncbi:hypothetical protein RF11_14606 [Thelohanellus kitauei]|uniref:Uncharacterized protein n=1 Tax=Thelohanellus kitauei TaxID=669202 RepID=A0A0C2MJH1_THEKT|nr:hypothetical protein RF11_14606 [Thelohanellus kitauei]
MGYVILKECISKINIPITIVNWNTCLKNNLHLSLKKRILTAFEETPLIKFINESNKLVQRIHQQNGFLVPDLFVAVGLTHRSIIKNVKKANIKNVVISGDLRGHVEYEEDPKGSLDLVYEVDTELMSKIIVDTIKPWELFFLETFENAFMKAKPFTVSNKSKINYEY